DGVGGGARSRQKPFRDAEVPADPVTIVAVVDVGQSFEARGEALAHSGLARVSLAPRLGTARHLERAVLGEELHDGVEIMSVEGGGDRLERGDRDSSVFRHGRSPVRMVSELGRFDSRTRAWQLVEDEDEEGYG